ncbi:MAG: hypothetical protein AB1861_03500 [Cyanobacteriota bacterium]
MEAEQFQQLMRMGRELISSIDRLAQAKNQEQSSAVRTGLGNDLTPMVLTVGRVGEDCWTTKIDGVSKPVKEKQLCGKVVSLSVKNVNSNEWGELVRFHLTLATETRPYVVDAGGDTVFTKNLLIGFSHATVEQLSQPIIIAVEPSTKSGSKSEKVVFCQMFDSNYQPINTIYQEEQNWDLLRQQAIKKIQMVRAVQHVPTNDPAPDNSSPRTVRHLVEEAVQQITPAAIDQNARIRAVRTLTGHSADQVKAWLANYRAKEPRDLNPVQCDALVKWLCIGWATLRLPNQHLASESYTKFVPGAIASGRSEEEAVRDWMRQVEKEVEGQVKS